MYITKISYLSQFIKHLKMNSNTNIVQNKLNISYMQIKDEAGL